MEKELVQRRCLDAIVESLRGSNLSVADGMGAVTGAAVQAFILISETTGRNTLRDLYRLRRNVTEVIKTYKGKNDGTTKV